jgi:hypothetical protein
MVHSIDAGQCTYALGKGDASPTQDAGKVKERALELDAEQQTYALCEEDGSPVHDAGKVEEAALGSWLSLPHFVY